MEHWFYLRLDGKLELCGKLVKLGNVSAEAVMTDGCHATMDTLRALACH
jgi:hypothetical protein